MSITSVYKNEPIAGRLGIGGHTYSFVMETSAGIEKYDIFANSIDEAIYIIGCTFGNVLNWTYIETEVLALTIYGYGAGTFLLY